MVLVSGYIDLASQDIKAFFLNRLANAFHQNEEIVASFQFSHGPVSIQLKRLQEVLLVLGSRMKSIGLMMTGAMNNDHVHMATIESINSSCPNLKEFSAVGLIIRNEQFNAQTLQPFFGRLEKLILEMSGFEGVYTFADCKMLKEWTQEICYGFKGKCLHFNFPELRSINFSKVDEIDNEHLEPFLSKNPQLKSITLTRCTIDPKILELISRRVPNMEEIALNFRRSLVKRSDMRKYLKYLLELEHLKALNLDCVGVAIGEILTKMAAKKISLSRVGLFCCPWEDKLIKAFADLKDLKSLHLSNITGLNDVCLGHLSPSLIGLTDLTLKFTENISMDGVMKLLTECPVLTTANIGLKKTTVISTDRYDMLLEAIKKRPEKSKLTIIFWGSKNLLKLSKDLLNYNSEFLEIRSEKEESNTNTAFDFYCESADGGYDLIGFAPPQGCNIN